MGKNLCNNYSISNTDNYYSSLSNIIYLFIHLFSALYTTKYVLMRSIIVSTIMIMRSMSTITYLSSHYMYNCIAVFKFMYFYMQMYYRTSVPQGLLKTRCTRGDARSFFCTYKTYLYAQN